MKPIQIHLKNKAHYSTKMSICSELAQKSIVRVHTYETPVGNFKVSKGKTIKVEEL